MPADVKSIFLAAADKPAIDRAAYLDEACAGDAALRQRVEALLHAHDEPSDAPRTPAYAPPVTPAVENGRAFAGRYKLRERLGEGGMGTVYVADQTEPVQRRVALKVIRTGLDSAHVIARFEQERQALALMDHPNIAKVFDAGVADVVPYFAMELIKGVPITRYCDEAKLTPRQRLELFVPVCQAVQHAHQKGVIHRDLKPSNVLVGLYDGKPVPKVIDFGVAKATGPRLTEHSVYTEVGSLVGTLEYMAPEQAELDNLDIDTRADIYALGVILYELLTGSVPLNRKELQAAGLAEMLRVIKEVEPPKPSTRLSGSGSLPTVAASRGLDPRGLERQLRGELDWIAMKCLEKERSRRYETANQLALEVQRYLADEPVLAGPPSVSYRLRKFARRHRGAVLAATLAVAALALAGAGATWGLMAGKQAELAERAEKAEHARADAETARANESAAQARRQGDRLLIQEGIRRADAGDLFGALPFFVRPLELGGLTADEEKVHRTRIACYLRHTPGRPVLRNLLSYETPIRHAEFSPDGRRLLLTGDRWLRVVDFATGAVLLSKPLSIPVDSARYGPDGSSILVASGPAVWTLSATTGEPLRKPTVAWNIVARADWIFPPAGGWDFVGQFAAKQSTGVEGGSTQARATLSPDGRTAVIACGDVASFWNVAEGTRLGPDESLGEPIQHVAFQPRGTAVLLAGGTIARVVDPLGKRPASKDIWFAEPPRCVAFSPDGRLVLCGSSSDILAWDAVSGERVAQHLHVGQTLDAMTLGPDNVRGICLVNEAGDESVLTNRGDSRVLVWRWNHEPLVERRLPHPWTVACTAFAPDGKTLVTGSRDHIVRVWDMKSGELLGPLLEHNAAVVNIAFDPSGRGFAAIAEGGSCRIWDRVGNGWDELPTGAEELPVAFENRAVYLGLGKVGYTLGLKMTSAAASREFTRLTGVIEVNWHEAAFSPCGRFALTSNTAVDSPRGYRLWNRRTARPIGPTIPNNSFFVNYAGFSPNGQHVAIVTSSSNCARIYDAEADGALVAELPHDQEILHIAFGAGGGLAATASVDGTARVWSVEGTRAVAGPLVHSSPVNRVVIDPIGRRVATASADQTARIWDAATGAPLTPAMRHAEAVVDVAFSPDGLVLATVAGGRGQLWDTGTGVAASPSFALEGGAYWTQMMALSAERMRISSGHRAWNVAPDTSSVAVLRDLAAFYAGHDLDPTGTPVRWAEREASARFQNLQSRRGEEFRVRPPAVLQWRDDVLNSLNNAEAPAAVALHRRWLAAELREADWQPAIPKGDSDYDGTGRLVNRLAALALHGRAAEATSYADAIAVEWSKNAWMLVNAARVHALAASAAGDAPTAERAARRALELLRQAAGIDCRALGTSELADPDLAALRGRADYADLLWELADGSPAT